MQDEFDMFIYFQIFLPDVGKFSFVSRVCGKSFRTLYGSNSVTLHDKEASSSEILILTFDHTQHRNRKLRIM